MPNDVKKQYYDLRTVVGDLSPSQAKQFAINQIQKQNLEREVSGTGKVYKIGTPEYAEAVRLLTEEYLRDFSFLDKEEDASGGRVGRAMGSPMMGEQPMQQEMVTEQQDVAMETQGDQGNKVYAMLRARLPQEISDEVVKLIAYNKEAFGDFASIKNQEDVNSFNEKYGVQLVIDMATV